MTRFPSAKHLASWAGTTPGDNESAGKVKSSRTRPGNPYLQGALGAAAMACSQNPHTYLGARYRRIATRRGPMKANVAIQHSMLIAIWHMGTTGTLYDDPGADYLTRLHPDRAKNRRVIMKRKVDYTWRLAELMAVRGLHNTTDLIPLLADRDDTHSRPQVYRLVNQRPELMSLQVLAALCDIFECTPADLLTITAADVRARKTGNAPSPNVVSLDRSVRPRRANILDE